MGKDVKKGWFEIMKLNFLTKSGVLKKGVTLSSMKKGLAFDQLYHIGVNSGLTKDEINFCNRYGVQATVYNIGCLREFGFVEIPDEKLKYLKNVKEV